MSRDFEKYAPKVRHKWMNNPNTANQICTCCGLKRIKVTKNYEITIIYITKDGIEHNENQPCIK